ncbi:MAG: C2 family cysteine protease [Cyanobacteria bacterium]|nr:C2 family cysteine protease [Cyanobacteriota bacterium]
MTFFDLPNVSTRFTIDATVAEGLGIRSLAGSDSVFGAVRGDAIYGNTGADNLLGSDGGDTLFGGRGSDILYGNRGADLVYGDRGNDILFGGRGSDSLLGGVGDDLLSGDAGFDILTGGDGADAFVLSSVHTATDPAQADLITDYDPEQGDIFALTDGAGDALTEANLALEAVGSDTVIRLAATGGILARVQNTTPDRISGNFTTLRAAIDDTESGATNLGVLPGSFSATNSVSEIDFVDFYRFSVTAPVLFDATLTGLAANTDADLFLYKDLDDDGELGSDEVIFGSTQGGNTAEAVDNMLLQPGDYFLSVEEFEGSTTYQLQVSGVANTLPRDLAGNSLGEARNLSIAGDISLNDYVGGTDAADFYRLEVTKSGYLDLFAFNQTAPVSFALGRDRNGNGQLDTDEIETQGTDELFRDSVDPGTYFLQVTAPGGATAYSLNAESAPGSRIAAETFRPIAPGSTIQGDLSRNDAPDPLAPDNYADSYQIQGILPGQTVTVTQTSEAFDAYLTLIDGLTGEVLAEGNDINPDGGNFNAQISFTVEQGRQYRLRASSTDAPGIGAYSLQVTATGTPIEAIARSNRNDGEEPVPRFVEGAREDTGNTTRNEFVFTYGALAGSLAGGGSNDISALRIRGVNQGGFGNCAFIAAVAATFGELDPATTAATKANPILAQLLQPVVTGGQVTAYTAQFYNATTRALGTAVQVNNLVVLNSTKNGAPSDAVGEMAGATLGGDAPTNPANTANAAIWMPILERAYAKWRGQEEGKNGYDVIGNGDSIDDPLRRLTGRPVEYFSFRENGKDPLASVASANAPESVTVDTANGLFERLQAALTQGRFATAGAGSDGKQISGGRLVSTHAYSVHRAYTDGSGVRKIVVRNPWGSDNETDVFYAEDPVKDAKDGFVEMTYDTFLKHFQDLAISL